MIIDAGEKVCIIERRYFAEDPVRLFIGEILASSESALRLKGYVWVYDMMKGLTRKPELRERILYPNDRTNINIIPKYVNINELQVVIVTGKGFFVKDSKEFSLDISEFGGSK
jgi:hypothetical protein